MARDKLSTFDQRVDWLVTHSSIWIEWFAPIAHEPLSYYIGQKNPRTYLVKNMKKDGLFAQSTYPLDVKLRNELVEALKVIRLRQILNTKFE